MSRVALTFSMSLDGFVAGPDVSMDQPMGREGERLHGWMFEETPDRALDDEMAGEILAQVGAVVLGRRTCDIGRPHWDGTPYPAPSFVVTHRPHPPIATPTGVFTFVTDGVESAISQARAAAGGRLVVVMGAQTAGQCLAAGLVDEIYIQLVPVLLAGGARLFDLIEGPMTLEPIRSAASSRVTHLKYRVRKAS